MDTEENICWLYQERKRSCYYVALFVGLGYSDTWEEMVFQIFHFRMTVTLSCACKCANIM